MQAYKYQQQNKMPIYWKTNNYSTFTMMFQTRENSWPQTQLAELTVKKR